MNQTALSSESESGASHADHDHSPFFAHHFESPQQQFDAGKLGMWLFLITEILFFSGLFVAYAVFRARHPEVFADAHLYLDKSLGTVNTVVLLFSSLTMAWAVRCAQLNQQRGLIVCLTTTLACASLFLGIKAIEYAHKWDSGIFWAGMYQPLADYHGDHGLSPFLIGLSVPALLALVIFAVAAVLAYARRARQQLIVFGGLALTSLAFFVGVGCAKAVPVVVDAMVGGDHDQATVVSVEGGRTESVQEGSEDAEQPPDEAPETGPTGFSPAGIFFSIYFAMTGVHAIHILAGMGVIAWLLVRSVRGDFTPTYFGPVDYVGLYWHLVDLVWIFLFPLLYLIQ
ncbi:MAG: cytochrome oxidase subunit III [Planctomycetaceae bacterium]|nr:MAG: cytochrome oxidase subunit III [Planctomycetaceae bacterium]